MWVSEGGFAGLTVNAPSPTRLGLALLVFGSGYPAHTGQFTSNTRLTLVLVSELASMSAILRPEDEPEVTSEMGIHSQQNGR